MYDYMVIDTQWVLMRNYLAIRGNEEVELDQSAYKVIISSVIDSIIGVHKLHPAKKVILLWDTYPYIKSEILSDYKGTRSYTTEEDVAAEMDPKKKELLRIDHSNLIQRGKAKSYLTNLSDIGLPSFRKTGWEADDLACIVSDWMVQNGKSYIFICTDGDWSYWLNSGGTWWSPKRPNEPWTYEDMMTHVSPPEGISLLQYKWYYDSFYASHNDLRTTVLDEHYNLSFKEFYSMYTSLPDASDNPEIPSKCSLFKDYDLFKRQLESFDLYNYREYDRARCMIEHIDKAGIIPNLSKLEAYKIKNKIDFNSSNYIGMIKKFDPSLFLG